MINIQYKFCSQFEYFRKLLFKTCVHISKSTILIVLYQINACCYFLYSILYLQTFTIKICSSLFKIIITIKKVDEYWRSNSPHRIIESQQGNTYNISFEEILLNVKSTKIVNSENDIVSYHARHLLLFLYLLFRQRMR